MMEKARKEYEAAFRAALSEQTGEAVDRLVKASDRLGRLMRQAKKREG